MFWPKFGLSWVVSASRTRFWYVLGLFGLCLVVFALRTRFRCFGLVWVDLGCFGIKDYEQDFGTFLVWSCFGIKACKKDFGMFWFVWFGLGLLVVLELRTRSLYALSRVWSKLGCFNFKDKILVGFRFGLGWIVWASMTRSQYVLGCCI